MLRIPVEAKGTAGQSVWCDVDTGALAHNVRAVRRRLSRDSEVIAVVKANAYGHGAVPVSRALQASGITTLAVGSVAEGVELRRGGIAGPLLLIGPVLPGEAEAIVAAALTPTLSSVEQCDALAAAAERPLSCHVELDTGLHRHGVTAGEFAAFVHALRSRRRLRLTGVFTHFAGLLPADLPQMRAQLRLFESTLARVRDLGEVQRHVCNTRGMVALPAAHLDAVRLGGGLLGFVPAGGADLGLRRVLSLRARCVGLREVATGSAVGYGGTFRCARPTRLALLPIGYADGFLRELWQGAKVLVRGQRVPIVGLISMNQTIVDITDVPGVQVGEVFTLLGADGDDLVTPEQLVGPGQSAYEVTSLLRADLPRRMLG